MRMKAQSRMYDETVSLQKPERTGDTEIGSVKEQRREEVEVLRPEISAVQSEDSSETTPGLPHRFLATFFSKEYLDNVASLLCTSLTVSRSGVKGLNRQDVKDDPNSLLSKTNEESRIKTSASCDVEDAKVVNSSRWEKRKWKENTKDEGIFQQLSYLLSFPLWPIRKKVRMPPKCHWMNTIFFLLNIVTATNALCLNVVYLELGKEGVLPCTCGNHAVVGWADEPDVPLLIYRENGTQKGPKYEDGEFEIQENGSLIIKNVEMKHARIYTSLCVPQQSGEHNEHKVEARVLPVAPYPVIDDCHSKLGDCMLTVPRYGILNCSVQVFPGITGPDLNLTMESETALLHLVDGPTTTEWNGKTFLKSSFSYEIEKSAGPFEIICQVEGLPPIDPRTKATVNVEDEVQGKDPAGVWVPIFIVSIPLSVGLGFLLAKMKELRKCTVNNTPAATDSNSVADHGNQTGIPSQNNVNETVV